MKKPNFGERMQEIKRKKAQAAKDKELTDRFPQIEPDKPMEQVVIIPPTRISPTEEVPAQTFIRPQETPLERTVRVLREKAQGL